MALLMTGTSLSIGAYLGFLALLGLSVRNGITQFSRYQALEQADAGRTGTEIAALGARRQCPGGRHHSLGRCGGIPARAVRRHHSGSRVDAAAGYRGSGRPRHLHCAAALHLASSLRRCLVSVSEGYGKNSKWMLAAASAALLVVGQPEILAADTGKSGPAKVEKVEGSNVARVILIQSAVDRLGIEVTPVREAVAPRKPWSPASPP